MSDKPLTEGKTRGNIKPLRKGSNPLPPDSRPPPPPSPPANRLLRESDAGPYCPQCGSSLKTKRFLKTKFCINSECDNYFEGETRTDQQILDDALVEAPNTPNEIDQVVITKDRLAKLCDDLDKSCDEMIGSSGFHTSTRLAVRMVADAIRTEFLK